MILEFDGNLDGLIKQIKDTTIMEFDWALSPDKRYIGIICGDDPIKRMNIVSCVILFGLRNIDIGKSNIIVYLDKKISLRIIT